MIIRQLAPLPRIPIRLITLGVLVAPLCFLPDLPLWTRFASCLMPLILTGTFRSSKIIETRFETRFHFAFVPFPQQKCKLAVVGSIETTYANSHPGIWTYVLFGPLQFVMGWIFDYLLPALGGPLEIWLVTAKGREIKAWQGFNQDQFDANLKLLQTHTTAELKTRSPS